MSALSVNMVIIPNATKALESLPPENLRKTAVNSAVAVTAATI